jgi:hypothetical protein
MQRTILHASPNVWFSCLLCLMASPVLAEPADREDCCVIRKGDLVELRSPAFVFCLNASSGLRAQWWENRLTGRRITLGDGLELGVDVGLPDGPIETLQWDVISQSPEHADEDGRYIFRLIANQTRLSARITYSWNAAQPVLRKLVEIHNEGGEEVNRLLNVRLGDYRVEADVSGQERGFPLYLDKEYFMSLAHPAGWATAEDGNVSLRQHPGVKLEPGEKFTCMETVYGTGAAGKAREAFLSHLYGRMRRVVRKHDKPYAIFEPFGARPGGNFDETEEFLLDNIAKLAQGDRDSGCHFDLYSVDFWVDYHGDLKRCDAVRFPSGLAKIKEELGNLGTKLGLWIDSSWERWSIGGNPDVQHCLNVDPRRPETLNDVPWRRLSFCRASEPIKSMYTEAFRHHIRENGARLLKFDNLADVCMNPDHDHLPGIYSTEPIQNAVIDFFHALDEECPDVFLMGYWGYRSPWWLLHADTLFDSGIHIEAASPSSFPAPYARDSVTQRLDQAQWHAGDVPPLGKDSLGIWLSDWGWNSSIGKERWEAGMVMDICRGSLLAQIWSDTAWLSPPERKQMADFIDLLKERPACFANPRFILGDPWKDQPYGYCCSDGQRAFLALNNCAWSDTSLSLKLNSDWGLPNGQLWDLFRWYPSPARLVGDAPSFGGEVSIALRPFEVVLLEAVPRGESPSLDRQFRATPIPTGFTEPSRSIELSLEEPANPTEEERNSGWTIVEPNSCSSAKGTTLTRLKDGSILAGGTNESPDTYTITAETQQVGITAVRLEVLPDASLPRDGPGRVFNGNFALNEFRVTVAPIEDPTASRPVRFGKPLADFAQESHGRWPIEATLDGNPTTGWSVYPAIGCSHVAIFPIEPSIGYAEGTRLTFSLQQGSQKDHNIGRFRLALTTAEDPPAIPTGYGPKPLVVKGQVSPTARGGMLVVSVKMSREGKPLAVRNVGRHLRAEGVLAGRTVNWQPVLGDATYPAPWQAWRLAVEPSSKSSPFQLDITTTNSSRADLICRGYFIAR